MCPSGWQTLRLRMDRKLLLWPVSGSRLCADCDDACAVRSVCACFLSEELADDPEENKGEGEGVEPGELGFAAVRIVSPGNHGGTAASLGWQCEGLLRWEVFLLVGEVAVFPSVDLGGGDCDVH